MSRHHILPPILSTPAPPKPNEARRKRGVGTTRGAGLTEETDETEEAGGVSRTTQPRTASALPQQQQQSPIESAERRVLSPNGKLSDDTLKAMLEVQEKDGEIPEHAISGTNDAAWPTCCTIANPPDDLVALDIVETDLGEQVGISVFVFDERAASAETDWSDWIRREIESAPKQGGNKPTSASSRLQKWFGDMRKSFPLIGDPDDSFVTEYCFYKNVIHVVFASSVGEEGITQAWRLADQHGLRLLVGDELLPRAAPAGKRDFHIRVLDGARPKPGIVPNMCFVVFDPDIEHVAPKKARAWVLERVEAGPWSEDRSVLTGDRLRDWINQFASCNLDAVVPEIRFYPDLIFIRVDRKSGSSMLSPIMTLSHKVSLPFEIYVDLA